jgi:hypothetical protein
MRPTKLAYLLVPALGAVILGVACRDQSPVAPPTLIERPDINLAEGGSMSGRATTTIRMFDGRSIAGTVIAADTNTFQAAIVPAGASHLLAARMTAGGKGIDFLLAVGDNGTARTGTWTVDGARRNNGPKQTLTLVAVGGAPVSEMTLRVGGEIVSRVATEWERVRGGWVATARTTMLYRGGKLARSMTTTFDDPQGARIAYSRTPIAAVATLSPPPKAASTYDCDYQFYSDPASCGSFGGGPCQGEIDGLHDAVTAYWVADGALAPACYAGILACAGATLYLLYTAHQIDVWDGRLDACIAGL